MTPAQSAAEAERLEKVVAQLQAGRRRWLQRLKKQGEKAPCGRKPRGFDSLSASLNRRERERAKADRRRLEKSIRAVHRDAEAESRRQGERDRLHAERRTVAEENERRLDPAPLPGESCEEHAARLAVVAERLRREAAAPRSKQVEDLLRRSGFYREAESYHSARPWRGE